MLKPSLIPITYIVGHNNIFHSVIDPVACVFVNSFSFLRKNMAQVIRQGRGVVLIHEGYKYQRNQTRPNTIYWRCSVAACRATLRTNRFDFEDRDPEIAIRNVGDHNHAP